nr:hypothetical protein [Tanacetum cinerariifolium]
VFPNGISPSKGYRLPPLYYAIKKTFKMIWLGYKSIHACVNDCFLFWGEDNKDKEFCLVCNTSRWKENNTTGKKVPKKVLRYFPITPRLQHLYKSSHTIKEMTWHATGKCTEPGKIQHLVDGRALVVDPYLRNNKWYQSLLRSFDQKKNNTQTSSFSSTSQSIQKMVKSSSSSDNEVFDNSLCSTSCKKNTDSLNTKIFELSVKLSDSKTMLYHYKLGLSQVEARLVDFKNQEIKLCEKIRGLKFKVGSKTNRIESLTNELEMLKKEKEGLDSKLIVLFPPPAQVYSPPKKDMSWTGLPEFADDTITDYSRPSPSIESNSNDLQNNSSSVSENGESASSILSKPEIKFVKAADSPTVIKTSKDETVMKPFVKYAEMYRKTSKSSNVRGNQRNWNNLKSQQLGKNFLMKNKACFNCGDFDHLSYGYGKWVEKGKSRPKNNTHKSIPPRNGNSQNVIDDKGYWDSGCSRHMTGNISYLSDYEPYDGGYVSFGHGGCKITGKGTIKTDKLEFENVYFVKDLKYNLFSVSQICDNKNSVLFTNSECIVLGRNFKLNDDTNVLLRTPRQHNMYSIDLNTVVPHKDLTCLVVKASADESMLWHRRLGHLNFKTMNRLVRHNLVKGLPSKCFDNDHTCVVCLKGKQHKASCKTKLVNSVSKPLHTLHMDLFRPTYDETSGILRNFIIKIENLKDLKGLGKFEAKEDEGYFIGYSMSSKAFRVFNKRTKRVEENLHVDFLENKHIKKGAGLNWLFDIDALTNSMNYVPVVSARTTSTNFSVETLIPLLLQQILPLEKYEHNVNFHQIVDFVEASNLRIETTDEGTKILATVDGFNEFSSNIATAVSSALPTAADKPPSPLGDDSQGEACPTIFGFEAEQDRENIIKTSTLPHDSPPRVTSLAADDGNATIKGRSLETGEEAGVDKSTERGKVPTVSVPTGSGMVPTANPIFTTASVVTPYSRRKGKEKMVESDTLKKKKLQEQIDVQVAREMEEQIARENQRMNEQIARDVEIARIHAEEELQMLIDSLDRNNETIAKYLQELGGNTAVYQFFVDMLKHVDREDLNQLWTLVKETLSIRHATSDKEKELWMKLKRLYEPDGEDQLWTHT